MDNLIELLEKSENNKVYKIYLCTKNKAGKVLKSDNFTKSEKNHKLAIQRAIGYAKEVYNFKGSIIVTSVFVKDGKHWHNINYKE